MKNTLKRVNTLTIIFILLVLSLFVFTTTISATTTYDICTITLTETGDGGVKLTWDAIDGAETYEIYRKRIKTYIFGGTESAQYNKVATTQDTFYTDELGVTKTTEYTYYVLPLDETGSANWEYEEATIKVHTARYNNNLAALLIGLILGLIIITIQLLIKRRRWLKQGM